MKQRIDVAGLYADALKALPDAMDGQPPTPMPMDCPLRSIEELLTEA